MADSKWGRRDRSATLRCAHEKRLKRKSENREKIIREPQFMRNHRKSFIMLGFMAVALFSSATPQETNKNKPEPSLMSPKGKTVVNILARSSPRSQQLKQPENVPCCR